MGWAAKKGGAIEIYRARDFNSVIGTFLFSIPSDVEARKKASFGGLLLSCGLQERQKNASAQYGSPVIFFFSLTVGRWVNDPFFLKKNLIFFEKKTIF